MPSLLNNRSVFVLIFALLLISHFSEAQESAQYFRYFEVTFDETYTVRPDVGNDLFGEKPFEVSVSCIAKNSIIVKVPADYPKRVHQIENDLSYEINKALNSDKIKSLRQLKATDQESFCP